MSYMLTLDEMSESVLIQELAMRDRMHKQGACDYCYRSPHTMPCRFPERHYDSRIDLSAAKCPKCIKRPGQPSREEAKTKNHCVTCQGTALKDGRPK